MSGQNPATYFQASTLEDLVAEITARYQAIYADAVDSVTNAAGNPEALQATQSAIDESQLLMGAIKWATGGEAPLSDPAITGATHVITAFQAALGMSVLLWWRKPQVSPDEYAEARAEFGGWLAYTIGRELAQYAPLVEVAQ